MDIVHMSVDEKEGIRIQMEEHAAFLGVHC